MFCCRFRVFYFLWNFLVSSPRAAHFFFLLKIATLIEIGPPFFILASFYSRCRDFFFSFLVLFTGQFCLAFLCSSSIEFLAISVMA